MAPLPQGSGRPPAARSASAHLAQLATIPLFQNLTPPTLQVIEQMVRPRTLARGQVLFTEGDPAEEMFVLVRGKAKMTRRSRQHQPTLVTNRKGRPMIAAPRESLLTLVGPGEAIGELSVMDGGLRNSTATAMLDCDLLCLPAAGVRRLMTRRHDLSLAMVRQLAHRARVANEINAHLVLSDVPGRLAWVLTDLAEHFGTPTDKGIVVQHDLTQTELAQMVGASRETVNKVLTDFVDRKWIATSGQTVVIKEIDRLRARLG